MALIQFAQNLDADKLAKYAGYAEAGTKLATGIAGAANQSQGTLNQTPGAGPPVKREVNVGGMTAKYAQLGASAGAFAGPAAPLVAGIGAAAGAIGGFTAGMIGKGQAKREYASAQNGYFKTQAEANTAQGKKIYGGGAKYAEGGEVGYQTAVTEPVSLKKWSLAQSAGTPLANSKSVYNQPATVNQAQTQKAQASRSPGKRQNKIFESTEGTPGFPSGPAYTVTAETRKEFAGLYKGNQGNREKYLYDAMSSAGISGPEASQFMAQMSWESDRFKAMEEYADGSAYEGRADLGNINKGDGSLYKGRGYIMLTGRDNYKKYGDAIGVDLVGDPSKASDPEIASKIAIEYWNDRVRSATDDFTDTTAVTKAINGGTNGLDGRKSLYGEYNDLYGYAEGGKATVGHVIPAENAPEAMIDAQMSDASLDPQEGIIPGQGHPKADDKMLDLPGADPIAISSGEMYVDDQNFRKMAEENNMSMAQYAQKMYPNGVGMKNGGKMKGYALGGEVEGEDIINTSFEGDPPPEGKKRSYKNEKGVINLDAGSFSGNVGRVIGGIGRGITEAFRPSKTGQNISEDVGGVLGNIARNTDPNYTSPDVIKQRAEQPVQEVEKTSSYPEEMMPDYTKNIGEGSGQNLHLGEVLNARKAPQRGWGLAGYLQPYESQIADYYQIGDENQIERDKRGAYEAYQALQENLDPANQTQQTQQTQNDSFDGGTNTMDYYINDPQSQFERANQTDPDVQKVLDERKRQAIGDGLPVVEDIEEVTDTFELEESIAKAKKAEEDRIRKLVDMQGMNTKDFDENTETEKNIYDKYRDRNKYLAIGEQALNAGAGIYTALQKFKKGKKTAPLDPALISDDQSALAGQTKEQNVRRKREALRVADERGGRENARNAVSADARQAETQRQGMLYQDRRETERQNVGIQNKFKAMNAQLDDRYNQREAARRDNFRSVKAQVLTQGISNVAQIEANRYGRDLNIDLAENMKNYENISMDYDRLQRAGSDELLIDGKPMTRAQYHAYRRNELAKTQ